MFVRTERLSLRRFTLLFGLLRTDYLS